MHLKILILLVLMAVSSTAIADNPRVKALIKEGLRIFDNEQYSEATEYFTKALSLEPKSAEAHYYLGECYRHLFEYEKAAPQYQLTIAGDSTAFPLAHFYVALTQKQAGQYRTAFRSFNDFLDFAQRHDFKQEKRWVNQAENEIQGILFVYELGAKPQGNFSLMRLPYPINSDYNDYAAQTYRHDSSVVLSSARPTSKGSIYDEKYGEYLGDHFVYEKQQQWVDQTSHYQLDKLNTKLNEGTGAFNAAGDQFFFTGCYQEGVCQIYISQRIGQQWSAPQALPQEINASNFSSKHPALSPDGNTLYFSSDRPGGQGMNDIWKSERKQDTWQPAVNVGSINTEQNEVSPYYYAPEKQLLFASNGHIGMGGYDLFFADVSAAPSTVTNAGYPFNSHKDDLYFHLGDQRGFLTSNRANQDGNFDIYSFLISTDDINLVAFANSRQQTDWYETQFTFSQTFDGKDRAFYEQLPLEEKQQVKQYIEHVAFQQSLSKYEAQSEAQRMEYEKLSPAEQETVQRLVVAKKQFLLENTADQLSSEDQLYYESLPDREKEKIDQIVNTRLFTLLSQEEAAGSGDEAYFYESLSAQEKEIVSGAVRKQQKFYQKSLEEQSTLADIFHYQSLTPEEKEQIEVLARTRSFALNLKEKTSLPKETQFFYEKLSEENQASIKRMAEARFQFLTKGTQQALLPEDYQFLATLSLQEKEQVQQMVDHHIERLYFLRSQDDPLIHRTYDYEQLPTQEKAQLERLIQARKLTFKIAQPVNEYSGFDLGKIADALPEKVSIRGRFKSKPSIDLTKQLTIYDHRQDTTIHARRDGEKGFVFDNVDYHQNLQISFSGVTRTFTQLPQDEIAELAITVLQDTIIQETFDNIYFDTNKYFIVDSAKHVLDSLAAFHHKYPDVIIQIKAFADSTGTDAYNMRLSKQRAQSIISYLAQHKVNVRSIQPIPMGAEKSHDLNHSRRVEFDILGVSASYNPTREVYVIQSEPNLAEIARQYQVPLEKLIEWNGGKRVIEPYTPIKIMAKRK